MFLGRTTAIQRTEPASTSNTTIHADGLLLSGKCTDDYAIGSVIIITVTLQLESFWTYELCHGRYIRQYHEERDGKKVKLQEYYLGKSDKEKFEKQSKIHV